MRDRENMENIEAIGIHFDFPRGYDRHLAQLFEYIVIDKYTWYVTCSDNYYLCNGRIEQFLPDGVYSGRDFCRQIHSCQEYYIHLVRLLAVREGKLLEQDSIHTYRDYMNSNAEIALLCADSMVDFYAKNPYVLKAVMESCERYFSTTAESPYFITLKNETRTGFVV